MAKSYLQQVREQTAAKVAAATPLTAQSASSGQSSSPVSDNYGYAACSGLSDEQRLDIFTRAYTARAVEHFIQRTPDHSKRLVQRRTDRLFLPSPPNPAFAVRSTMVYEEWEVCDIDTFSILRIQKDCRFFWLEMADLIAHRIVAPAIQFYNTRHNLDSGFNDGGYMRVIAGKLCEASARFSADPLFMHIRTNQLVLHSTAAKFYRGQETTGQEAG